MPKSSSVTCRFEWQRRARFQQRHRVHVGCRFHFAARLFSERDSCAGRWQTYRGVSHRHRWHFFVHRFVFDSARGDRKHRNSEGRRVHLRRRRYRWRCEHKAPSQLPWSGSDVEYGNTLDKDAGEYSAEMTFGVGDDKTQVTGTMNFYHHNSVFNHDRGFSALPPFLSSNSSPLNLQLADSSVIAAGGIPPAPTGATDIQTFGSAPLFTNGLAAASNYLYTDGRSRAFNFNSTSGSYPESERWAGNQRRTEDL